MMTGQYRRRLEADLAHWVDKGWVSAEAAVAIRADAERSGRGGLRLPALLGGVGAICLALAVAAFVAANWPHIPRPFKLAGIATLVIIAHGLAAWAASRGFRAVADLATLFATLVFVAGLALVGQMYHLPSDWAGGALLVALGALFAAWGARSRGALLVAVPAIVVWMIWRSDGFSLSLPVVGFALGLLVATGAHALRYPGLATRWAVLAQAIATYVWLVLGAMEMRMIIADEEVAFYGLMSMLVLGTAFSVLGYVLTREELFAARFGDGTRLMAETALSVGALMLTGGVFVALMLTFGFDTYEVEILEIITLWPIGCVIVVTAGGIGYSVLAKTGRAPALSVGFAVALALLMPVAMAILPGATTVHAVIALAAMIAVSVAGSFTYLLSWTVLGNLGIAAVLLFLLQVTVGSLIGQSVFFLIAGLVLIAVAFVSARMIRQHGRGTGERTI